MTTSFLVRSLMQSDFSTEHIEKEGWYDADWNTQAPREPCPISVSHSLHILSLVHTHLQLLSKTPFYYTGLLAGKSAHYGVVTIIKVVSIPPDDLRHESLYSVTSWSYFYYAEHRSFTAYLPEPIVRDGKGRSPWWCTDMGMERSAERWQQVVPVEVSAPVQRDVLGKSSIVLSKVVMPRMMTRWHERWTPWRK